MALPKFLDHGKPYPGHDVIAGPGGMLSPSWASWFARLTDTLASIPNIMNVTSLEEQDASITATDLSGFQHLPAGLYRVTYAARITTAAVTSSSLTVTIAWTDGAVAQSQAGAAMTGNTTTTRQTASYLVRIDADSDLTYATTYASNGAGEMKYSLDIACERIAA
jgi:hypothetical protein